MKSMQNVSPESKEIVKLSDFSEKDGALVNINLNLSQGVTEKFAEAMKGRKMTLGELFSCTAIKVASNRQLFFLTNQVASNLIAK